VCKKKIDCWNFDLAFLVESLDAKLAKISQMHEYRSPKEKNFNGTPAQRKIER
jgi:hypothetical protein